MTAVNVFMQLTQDLSHDFIREGWLYKTGPDPDSKYKKRWMSLDRRQLFYSAQPLVNVAVETYPSCCHGRARKLFNAKIRKKFVIFRPFVQTPTCVYSTKFGTEVCLVDVINCYKFGGLFGGCQFCRGSSFTTIGANPSTISWGPWKL